MEAGPECVFGALSVGGREEEWICTVDHSSRHVLKEVGVVVRQDGQSVSAVTGRVSSTSRGGGQEQTKWPATTGGKGMVSE